MRSRPTLFTGELFESDIYVDRPRSPDFRASEKTTPKNCREDVICSVRSSSERMMRWGTDQPDKFTRGEKFCQQQHGSARPLEVSGGRGLDVVVVRFGDLDSLHRWMTPEPLQPIGRRRAVAVAYSPSSKHRCPPKAWAGASRLGGAGSDGAKKIR